MKIRDAWFPTDSVLVEFDSEVIHLTITNVPEHETVIALNRSGAVSLAYQIQRYLNQSVTVELEG